MVFSSLVSFSITFIFSTFCSLLLTITLFLHSIFLNQSCSLHYFSHFSSCCHWLLVVINYLQTCLFYQVFSLLSKKIILQIFEINIIFFWLQNFNISLLFVQMYEFHISCKKLWTWVLCAYCKLVVNCSHSCCSCYKLPNELNLL
jgi:hypothetical protein